MKKNKPTYLTDLERILQTRTQREAAILLGVSDRTIRRWKNEGSIPKPERQRKVVQMYREDIQTKKAAKSNKFKAKLDRIIGGSYFYKVEGTGNWNIAMTLKYINSVAPKGYPPLIRFVIRVPKGGTSPGGREFKQGGFYSSMIMSLEHAETDNDYLDIVEEFNTHGRIFEVVRMLPWEKKPVTVARKGKHK